MIEDIYKLSPLQEGIYYHWLRSPSSKVYVEQFSFTLKGDFNPDILRESYYKLVDRHQSLRSFFTSEYNDELLQVVQNKVIEGFSYLDCTTRSTDAVKSYQKTDRDKGFNLHAGSMMRFSVLRISVNSYQFIWTHHHIIMDGWCVKILIEDFFKIYENLASGGDGKLAKEPVRYSKYIQWLDRLDSTKVLEYWKEYLSGYSLPNSFIKKSLSEDKIYLKSEFFLDEEISELVKSYCKTKSITQSTLMQFAWGVLLSIYNDSNDVLFGCVVSGRPPEIEEIENMVGLLINTIPVRICYNNDDQIGNLLQKYQSENINNTAYHHAQLAEVQALSGLQNYLIDNIFAYQNQPVQEIIADDLHDRQGRFSIEKIEIFEETSYALNLVIGPTADGFRIRLLYDKYCIPESFLSNFKVNFSHILRTIISNENKKMSEVRFLNNKKEEYALQEKIKIANSFRTANRITDYFEKIVNQFPNKTALTFKDGIMSYSELDKISNRFAVYLKKNHSILLGDFVGVKLPKDEWVVIAILGILKAGAAYVPIDPTYPNDRVTFLINDSNCKVIVDDYELKCFKKESQALSEHKIVSDFSKSDPAYVIYTSGTTGVPKGTIVEHENLVSLIYSTRDIFKFNETDIWAFFHSYSFDFSVWEIFGALLTGGNLIIVSNEEMVDPELFRKLLLEFKVTILNQTPSSFFNLLFPSTFDDGELKLRYLIFGGESLNIKKLSAWRKASPNLKFINMYGITETTVHVTYKEITDKDILAGNNNIGKPLPSLVGYVLDRNLNLAPTGGYGELFIGGIGVARGYLDRPNLTKEKFVVNPFSPNSILYRSGDKVRILENGELEYIGRLDEQVKIRGFRIEPKEIEYAISNYPGVNSVAVQVVSSNDERLDLAAFMVANVPLDMSIVKSFLSERLPRYMIPSLFKQLDHLPVTKNGKIDKKRLSDLIDCPGDVTIDVENYNDSQKKLLVIWKKILMIDHVRLTDDFFNLGGHSLKLIRLSNQLFEIFNIKIPIKQLFINSQFQQQSELIQTFSSITFRPIKSVRLNDSYVCSSSQKRLIASSRSLDSRSSYNISTVFQLVGDLDVEGFRKALVFLIGRHESFRTVFREWTGDEPRQVIVPMDERANLEVEDLRDLLDVEGAVRVKVMEDISTVFDLGEGPLYRIRLYRTGKTRWVFSAVMHHVVSDGWSMRILVRELFQLYNSFGTGRMSTELLPVLNIQYKDYASWQRERLRSGALDKDKEYWLGQFGDGVPVLYLPSDRPRPHVKTNNGGIVGSMISSVDYLPFRTFCQDGGATLFMGLLTITNILLYRYTGQHDLVVGSPIAGRDHADLEDQVGFYVNTLALRSRFDGDDSFGELLHRVRALTLEAYEHQAYPFDELVSSLEMPRDISRNTMFDVMVVLQNTELNGDHVVLDGIQIEEYKDREHTVSKFDLTFNFEEVGDQLNLRLEYNSDLYNRDRIERMVGHFQQLMKRVVKTPSKAIKAIDYLTGEERQQVLYNFNRTGHVREATTLVEMFERQVEQTPRNTAIVFKDRRITYKELNENSNRIARYLIHNYRVKQDDLVGLQLERSDRMISAMLGILKAGAAYVPIDPDYPQDRITYIRQDSGCKVVLDRDLMKEIESKMDNYSPVNPNTELQETNLAYIIYTSGTTGKPKGTLIEHKNATRLFYEYTNLFLFEDKDVWMLVHSYCFDFSVWEIFGALLNGAKLIVLSADQAKDAHELFSILENHRVTILNQTPSSFSNLLKLGLNDTEATKYLRYLIFGGEALYPKNLLEWKKRNLKVKVVNMYGITETTVHSTYKEISMLDMKENVCNVGNPLPLVSCYILDDNMSLVPLGIWGEIYIGGEGLARGYHNRENLTKSKFISNPFENNKKLYKSGDIGRFIGNYEIEYRGRKDKQIKIRGYRIEIAEIEITIKQLQTIQNVFVDTITIDNNLELVAYYSADNTTSPDDVRSYLIAHLPRYMCPTFIIYLDKFPLTVNGKVDRSSLPVPIQGSGHRSSDYIPPNSKIEIKVVQIWEELFDIAQLGLNDDFFSLGGHSMKVGALIMELHKVFDVKIKVEDVYQNPTIKDLSSLIANIIWASNDKDDSSNLENHIII